MKFSTIFLSLVLATFLSSDLSICQGLGQLSNYISTCTSNDQCLNRGFCQQVDKKSSGAPIKNCICPSGYTGKYCGECRKSCTAFTSKNIWSPCANNGSCITASCGFSCDCAVGFSGPNCL